MPMKSPNTRRRFVKFSIAGLVASPFLTGKALAQDQVPEDDPTAQTLGYVHDAAQSAKRTDTTQTCHNCHLFAGSADDEWGPCAIFQNRLVKGSGWCSAWVLKAG